MYKTGRVEIKINYQPFYFHFGMNAQSLSMEKMKNYDDNIINQLRSILWAGAMVCKDNNLDPKFSMEDMGDIIDSMSQDDYDRVMEEAQSSLGKMMQSTIKIIGSQRMAEIMSLLTKSITPQ